VLVRSDGEGWDIRLRDGRQIRSRAAVLAIGNEAPQAMVAMAGLGDRLVTNPWTAEAREALRCAAAAGDDILIVGTGLTMVDTVLSLDEAGFRGRMVAVSRRGLVPRAHAAAHSAPDSPEQVPKGSVRAVLRWIRHRSAEIGWRAVMDSLREHNQSLWRSLPLNEQRRFLRHARPWWDVHRHRIAPAVAERIKRLIADGRLEILAGRIVTARREGEGIGVEIAGRGAAPRSGHFGLAVNCTGPLHSLSRTANPLLRSLLDSGAARPDALDIGLEVDGESRVSGSNRLWAMSTLTKGHHWEITAVPDIRVQAAKVADAIARELAE
jgi:uncharacterized NAD(P)/FAD-binding protein YdhS